MIFRSLKTFLFESFAAVIPFGILRKSLPARVVLYGHVVANRRDLTARKYRYPNLREFADLVTWWRNLGYSFSDVSSFMENDGGYKILLTFDDGFRALAGDLREYLKKEEIPSMIFILTDTFHDESFGRTLLGPGAPEKSCGLFLSEDEVRLLKEEGVHIGFHTRSHFRFEDTHNPSDPAIAEQLTIPPEFRPLLSNPLCFAYPYQAPENFERLDAFLKNSGYRWIFDTKGFRAPQGNHWFRVSIDAENNIRKRDWIRVIVRRQLLQAVINRRRAS